MPKFLHTGDLHLNTLRRFSKFYLSRIRAVLDSVLQTARAHGVDFILVAGDVYDRRDITHLERQLLSAWLASSEIPIVVISGNHDKRSDEVGDTCLSYLSSLRQEFHQHLIYDGAPTVVERFGCNLILLPYQGWMDQELFLILDTLVSRATSGTKVPLVVVMHEAVQGCQNDVGLTITKSNQIRLDDAFPQVDYWALGDMHICQQITEHAWYSGSPHQTRFDELPEKGVLIVDTDNTASPEFVSVPSIPLIIMDEEPARWPSPQDAFVQFRPDGHFPSAALPPNVEYHPSSVVVHALDQDGEHSTGELVGIYEGLASALLRAGLRPEMVPLAWRLAVKLAKGEGIDVALPQEYQLSQEKQS